MSGGNWSGIGYNPAPGSVQATGELATKLSRTATYLQETYEVLNSIQGKSEVWQGEASKAFASKIEDLPKYLDNAHKSLEKASKCLGGWEDNLADYQKRAQTLEEQARAARGRVSETESELEKARANPAFNLAGQHFGTDAELRQAEQRLANARAQADAAAQKAEQAKVSLEQILRKAENLKQEHESTADETARKIQAADDGLAPPEPNWWDDVVNWLAENAGTIGDIAGLVSAVAGVLAFVPVLAPIFGPIAIAAGAVALAAHGLDMGLNWEEKSDNPGAWVGLAADAVGVIPGVTAVTKGISAMGDATGIVGKAGSFCVGVGADASGAAKIPMSIATKYTDEVTSGILVKAGQSYTNLTTQVPTVAEWATDGKTMETEKNAAGVGALIGNGLQVL